MKKVIFIAAFAASGLVVVSCDTEGVESSFPQQKGMPVQKEVYTMALREGDTIPEIDTTLVLNLEGPGDDPIPVPPPPKKP